MDPPGLAERVGGLDAELDWAHTLSLGEQQRIAFLRLLVHRPAVAVLDGARRRRQQPSPRRALVSRAFKPCAAACNNLGGDGRAQRTFNPGSVQFGAACWK